MIGPGPVARGTGPLRELGKIPRPRRGSKTASTSSPASGPACGAPPGPSPSSAAASPKAPPAAPCSATAPAGRRRAPGCSPKASTAPPTAASRRAPGSTASPRARKKLAEAQRKTAVGSLTLQLGLRSLVPKVRGNGLARARDLATELAEAAGEDPALRPRRAKPDPGPGARLRPQRSQTAAQHLRRGQRRPQPDLGRRHASSNTASVSSRTQPVG